jgi:large subunit ribosomal protein L18
VSCICQKKQELRKRRQKSVRRKVRGTELRPRLCIFRSGRHMYVQVIDDVKGETILAVSTLSKAVTESIKGLKPVDQAKLLGSEVAKLCIEKSIKEVCFDRNGFIYHGRVAAVAQGAREAGLLF